MENQSIKYWVNKNGENLGPFSYPELVSGEERGELEKNDLVCPVGGVDWVSVGDTLGLNFEHEVETEVGPQRVVVSKRGGTSLNLFLTAFALFLLLICGGLFLYLRMNHLGQEVYNEKSLILNEEGNLKERVSSAVDFSSLLRVDGLVQNQDGTNFTGWAKEFYEDGKTLSLLLNYGNGLLLEAFSWKPSGEESNETSLNEGTGFIVRYFFNGMIREKVEYQLGQLFGTSMHWHKSGGKAREESYSKGKLHGQKVIWNENGQKTEETFYLLGVKNGPYSRWSKNGQKIEEGVYKNGLLEGKRTTFSVDGIDRIEEFFVNGQRISQEKEIGDNLNDSLIEDRVLTQLLAAAGENENLIIKANRISDLVKSTMLDLEKRDIQGGDVFLNLGVGLIKYTRAGESDPSMIKDSLDWINNQWGISVFWSGNQFQLSELPEKVILGSITWGRSEFSTSVLGALEGESRSLIISNLKTFFSLSNVSLGIETETISTAVKAKIWDTLVVKAEDFKAADLSMKNEIIVFKSNIEKKIKKINPQGKSEFETANEEISYSFDRRAVDKKAGPFFDILSGARAQFEETQNGTLKIRKYSNLVLFSDRVGENGARFLYPNVTIQLAGLAPFSDLTLIRAVKVELGDIIEEPTLKEID